MAFTTRYYRLFEVRILHEYYLLAGGGHTFYDQTAAQRDNLLAERLMNGHYRLMNDLDIIPDTATARLLANQKLLFKKTATGFVVLAHGVTGILPTSGNPGVLPFLPLSDTAEFNFFLKPASADFWNYTSFPMKSRPLPDAGYFLSNRQGAVAVANDFASLSQPVAAFQAGDTYTPGDIALVGANISEATAVTTTSANDWEAIEGNGYVTESDRSLLPKTYSYNVSTGAVGLYSFSLRTLTGDLVKNIDVPGFFPPGNIKLDFSFVKTGPGAYDRRPIADGHYDLDITTPSGTSTRRVYLAEDTKPGVFGMVNIGAGATGPQQRIKGVDGELLQPHPVFEIRLRSRRTFWCYRPRNQERHLSPAAALTGLFVTVGGPSPDFSSLITVVPQKLTYLPVEVTDGAAINETLPRPSAAHFVAKNVADLPPGEPAGRLYSDVPVLTVGNRITVS